MLALPGRLIVVAVGVLIALAACGGDADDNSAPLGGSASRWLPNDSLQDWANYAIQLSVVTVLAEETLEPHPETAVRGEGYVARRIRVRIETTGWVAQGADEIAGEIEMFDWGWRLKDGELHPFNSARLEVGSGYLLPLADIHGEYGSMSLAAIPMAGGLVTDDFATEDRWMLELAGKGLGAISAELSALTRDPLPAQFAHLPSVDRYEAVSAVRAAEYFTVEAARSPTATPTR